MDLRDIQDEIEKREEERVKKEFLKALMQCSEILTPFFSFKPKTKHEEANAIDCLENCLHIVDGRVQPCEEFPPKQYIAERKVKAVDAFMYQFPSLEDELEKDGDE